MSRRSGPLPAGISSTGELSCQAILTVSLTRTNHIPDDVIIALMGVTGAGKSTFIKLVTGRDDIVVGHALTSETADCKAYSFKEGKTNFSLIDTPGFDDTFMDDGAVLEKLADFMAETYRAGALLSAIIYVHPIHHPRFEGSARDNLTMFQTLCGENFFRNIVLATSFWSEVETEEEGSKREAELKDNPQFWGDMIARGSGMVRLPDSKDEAIALLMKLAGKEREVMRIQQEVVDEGRALRDTEAAASTARLRALRSLMQDYLARIEEVNEEERLERARRQETDAKDAAQREAEVQAFIQTRENERVKEITKMEQDVSKYGSEVVALENEMKQVGRQAWKNEVLGHFGQVMGLISSGFMTGATRMNISMVFKDTGIPLCDVCHRTCSSRVSYCELTLAVLGD
jgi:hypothetical protein